MPVEPGLAKEGALRRYLHYLRTGSGSDQVEVRIDGEAAGISILTHWMGSDSKRYGLSCRHQSLAETHGLLVVDRVEAATGEDASLQVISIDEDEEEMLLPLVVEYVTVPPSPVYIHGQSQLNMMRPLGYADWNDSFELILMIPAFGGKARHPSLAEICDVLDKKKLTPWSDAAEVERAARERDEGEASSRLWASILGGTSR